MMNTSAELSPCILDRDQKERAMTVLYFGFKFLHWSLFSILFVAPLVVLPTHLNRHSISYNEIKTYEEFRTALTEAKTAGEIRRLVHELRLRDNGPDYKKEKMVIEGLIELESFGLMDTVRDIFSSVGEYRRYSNGPIIFTLLTPVSYFMYFLICIVNFILWGKVGFLPWRV